MLALLGGILYGFAWGIRRGASSCMALCVPAIIPALIEEKGSWRKGFMIAFYYNLPRIVVLTILGMAIGAGGYYVGEGLDSFTAGSTLWALAYVIIGAMMIAYGTYTFARISERLDDLAEGEVQCAEKSFHPIFSRFKFAVPKTRPGLMLWGGIVSLACVGETVLAIEALFVGALSTGSALSPLSAAVFGGLAFFMVGLGTAIPTLALASFSTTLADREKRVEKLLQIERLAGILMIAFGVILLFSGIFLI